MKTIRTVDTLPPRSTDVLNVLYRLRGGTGTADTFWVGRLSVIGKVEWERLDASASAGVFSVIATPSIGLTLTNDVLSADAIFGAAAGTVAQGDHTHAQLHDPVTVTDTASIDLTVAGQDLSAAVILDGHTQSAATITGLGTMATQNATAVAITGGTVTGITDLALADGGTGASDASTARTNLGLGTIATQAASAVSITGGSVTGITDVAIADGGTGASTAAAALTNLGLTATAAELNFTDGVTSAIQTQLDARQPLDADLTTIAGLTATTDNVLVSVASAWASRTPAQVRTTLALVPGTDVQAQDAELTALAGLTSAADKVPYFTGAGTAAVATQTTFARTLLDDADATTARTTLGLVIGTNVQAYSANLDEYAAVNPTAAGLALLDDADAAAQLVTLGVHAPATVTDTTSLNLTLTGQDIQGAVNFGTTAGVAMEGNQAIIRRFALTTGLKVWTNQPAAVTDFMGELNVYIVRLDLLGATGLRMTAACAVAGAANAKVRLQYSLLSNRTDTGTWVNVSVSDVAIDALGLNDSGWQTIPGAMAANDVYIKLCGYATGSGGTGDPQIGNVVLSFR